MSSWLLKLFSKKPPVRQVTKRVVHQTTNPVLESGLLYVRTDELDMGMYVSELDRPWIESPFRLQGFNIKTERELKALKTTCDYVYINRAREIKVSLPPKSTVVNSSLIEGKTPKKRGSFEKEIQTALRNYLATGRLVSGFMNKVKNGGGIDTKQANEAIASSVDSILQSPDAYLWLTQLKKKDEYTAQHSLNTSMLSIVFGRHIGLAEPELRNLGLCGMMHDMGKMLVPSDILNKRTKLNPHELKIMNAHTTLGAELLKSSDNMFHGAIETALMHHDGVKSPGSSRETKGSRVSFYSNVISIVDAYDALTSDKVYKKAMTHLEAIQVLHQQAGDQFSRPLVSKFIESLGVFPPGCYVQLSDGRIALVLEGNEESKLRPKVVTVMDVLMNPVKEMIINLEKVLTDIKGNPLHIQNIISPEEFNIDRESYFQEGIVSKGFTIING